MVFFLLLFFFPLVDGSGIVDTAAFYLNKKIASIYFQEP